MSKDRFYIYNAALPGELPTGAWDDFFGTIVQTYYDFRDDTIRSLLGLKKYVAIVTIVELQQKISGIFFMSDTDTVGIPEWAQKVKSELNKVIAEYKLANGNSWDQDLIEAKKAYRKTFPLVASSLTTLIYDSLEKMNIETETTETTNEPTP